MESKCSVFCFALLATALVTEVAGAATPPTNVEVQGVQAKWYEYRDVPYGYLHSFVYPTGFSNGAGSLWQAQGSFPKTAIYYSDALSRAQLVKGAILDKWLGLGAQASFLGYPTTDERDTPMRDGRYNHFQGGSVYYEWGGPGEAYEVHGCHHDVWSRLGWEQSTLGWPRSDEYTGSWIEWVDGWLPICSNRQLSNFETGRLIYNGGSGSCLDLSWPVFHTRVSGGSGVTVYASYQVTYNGRINYTVWGGGLAANVAFSLYANTPGERQYWGSGTSSSGGTYQLVKANVGSDVRLATRGVVTLQVRDASGRTGAAGLSVPPDRAAEFAYNSIPKPTYYTTPCDAGSPVVDSGY